MNEEHQINYIINESEMKFWKIIRQRSRDFARSGRYN